MGRKYFADAQILGTAATPEVVSADKTTLEFPIQGVDVVGFTFKWSASTVVGVFIIQVSFDGITWFDLETGAMPIAGTSGQIDADITENRYNHVRGFLDIASGSGSFLGWYSASSKGN